MVEKYQKLRDNRPTFPFSTDPDPNFKNNDDLSKLTKLRSKKGLRKVEPQNVQKSKKVLPPPLSLTFLPKNVILIGNW